MNNINTAFLKNRLNLQIVFLSMVVLVLTMSSFKSNELHAAERTSYSIDKNIQSKIDIKSVFDTNIQKAPALVTTGEQAAFIPIDSSNRVFIGLPNLTNDITTNSVVHSFSIFDANVELLHDDDGDGYYHFFSVSFDADIDAGSAIVYARMFISYEGGPWNHYYTTKTFEIFSNDEFDTHTVDTVFSTGYPPGSYDIRIDLYEAGWLDRVAVYGPYEDYDLSYLSLEDEEHDFYVSYTEPHVDVVVAGSGAGCSLNTNSKFDPVFPAMFLLGLIYLLRGLYSRYRRFNTVHTTN